jgi:hypothetical protein
VGLAGWGASPQASAPEASGRRWPAAWTACRPLVNHANQTIQTSSNPHPDAHDGGPTALGCANGICSYTGEGAALNDYFGTERDANGVYYSGTERCHMIVHEGVVVPGAKRAIAPNAPLQWLPVDPTLFYANGIPNL